MRLGTIQQYYDNEVYQVFLNKSYVVCHKCMSLLYRAILSV